MTNQTPEQFISQLRTTRMTDVERSALRTRLQAYAAMHPARPVFWALLVRHTLAYSLAMVFLLAGSTFALACYAKPDSFLYPVRVAIAEPIAVAISGDTDAQLEKELEQIGNSIRDEQRVADTDLAFSDDTTADQELETELNALQRELDDATKDLPSEN